MFWKGSFVLLISFHLNGAYTTDPCTNYTEIHDIRMTVAYTASGLDSLFCPTLPPLNWYRYIGTTSGRMESTCPRDMQCGSQDQIWFNDTVPTKSDGEIDKNICIHEGPKCCSITNKIKTKNCTDYIVYKHVPVKSCTNYCYEAPGGKSRSENAVGSILVWLMIATGPMIRYVFI